MLRIEGDVDPRGVRVAHALMDAGICHAVEYCEGTRSTNTMALADVRDRRIALADVPVLYLTDRQTAGRGRHGRSWLSSDGTLTFSLVLPRPKDSRRSSMLTSLAAGVGVARSVEFEFAPLKTRLKWPNDVYIDGGKLAGILLETAQNAPGHMVVGVGLNVGNLPASQVAMPIRSLSDVVGRQVHRYDVLESIVTHIVGAIADADQSPDSLLADFRAHCLLTSRPIRFQEGSQWREGWCRGVSDLGELTLQTGTEIRQLQSGEVQLVRTATVDPNKR